MHRLRHFIAYIALVACGTNFAQDTTQRGPEIDDPAWFASVAPPNPQSVIFENDARVSALAYYESWARHFDKLIGPISKPVSEVGRFQRTILSITLNEDGSLRKIDVVRSSSRPNVDEIAVRAVKEASPYPRVPSEILNPERSAILLVPFDHLERPGQAFVRVGRNLAEWRAFRSRLAYALQEMIASEDLPDVPPVDIEIEFAIENGRIVKWSLTRNSGNDQIDDIVKSALSRFVAQTRAPDRPKYIVAPLHLRISP